MSSSIIGEHMRLRRATRNQTIPHINAENDPPLTNIVLPISQPSTFCNSTMSSFFLLPTFSKGTTRSFRGMGCTAGTAQQEVSVPSLIRSSANWDARIRKDKKKKNKNKNKGRCEDGSVRFLSEARDINASCCAAVPVTDRSVNSTVVSDPPRRTISKLRRKIDVNKTSHNPSHGSSVLPRRFPNHESHSHAFLNSDSPFMSSSRAEPTTIFSSRFRGHIQRPYPDDLTEMMMLRNRFVMRRIREPRDHFHDLRLDVDNLSYEQLLELGDRIGYVNTGLKENEIHSCIRKLNPSVLHTLVHRKCSICQDEFEREAEVGMLECGHNFHVQCIKQWLSRKNACPVCKKIPHTKPSRELCA